MPRNIKPMPDAEAPEWTAETFRRAKRLHELPDDVQTALKRKGRGPQKAPTKQLVSIRLSPDVLKALRSTGTGWQRRADDALRARFVTRAATSKAKSSSSWGPR